MSSSEVQQRPYGLDGIASRHEGLELLVLFGSRARGDSGERSDWDLGFVAREGFDPQPLQVDLSRHLRTDALDLADLSRSNGLLRYRVARDGLPVFERLPGAFHRFWEQAVFFWLDIEAVIRPAYRDILHRLGSGRGPRKPAISGTGP